MGSQDALARTAPALVTAVDHVGIAVADLDEAIAWYESTLAFPATWMASTSDSARARLLPSRIAAWRCVSSIQHGCHPRLRSSPGAAHSTLAADGSG